MTKGSHWLGASALALFGALSACGTKANGGGTGGAGAGTGVSGNIAAACLGQYAGSACSSCLETACGSALGSFANDCGDYIDCYCPNGQYSSSAQSSQACVSKITVNPSCLSSAQGINNCVQQSCSTACSSTGAGSGSSSGGGGGGSSGSSGGAGGATSACGVAFTTAACAGCVMSMCCSVTQTCAQDQACISIITCIHQCAGNMTCEENCVSHAPMNAQTELNSAGSCWASCNGC